MIYRLCFLTLALLSCGALLTEELPKLDIPHFQATCILRDGSETVKKHVTLSFDYRNLKGYESCLIEFEKEVTDGE